MLGLQPFLTRIPEPLQNLIRGRAGNNRPKEMSQYGVSGLKPWVRIISCATDKNDKNVSGLVMDSISPYSNFTLRYGGMVKDTPQPGILGYQLDQKTPVTISGSGRSLRPSPIITGLTAKNAMEGTVNMTLSTTTFTVEQAEELSKYILEPGFFLLVEWGWNTAKSRSQIVGGGSAIDYCDIVQYNNYSFIKDKMEKSDFQYFASLGTITGGEIKFGKDETFEITSNIIGMGSMAEYLQLQNGTIDTESDDKSSDINFEKKDFSDFESKDASGKVLFAKMFNELPSNKKTDSVKNLINNEKWSDSANFINIDEDIIDDIKEGFTNFISTKNETLDIKISKDMDIISNLRYIRMELAVEILNSFGLVIEPNDSECPKGKTRDMRINISDTIISGFPHIFSSDSTKLFIPNVKTPNFNFLKALQDPTNEDQTSKIVDFGNMDSDDNLSNNHPFTNRTKLNPRETKNGQFKDYALGTPRPVPYAFPCTYALDRDVASEIGLGYHDVDETVIPVTEDAFYWGFLKDLYINFDFFTECLSKPNVTIKEVFYDMLNALSSAVNSIWHFEVVESFAPPNPESKYKDGDLRLIVIDRNFRGKISKDQEEYEKPFQTRGLDSPFLDVSFSTKSSAAMVGSTMITKMNPDISTANDGGWTGKQLLGVAYAVDREDKVGTAINSFSLIDTETYDVDGEPKTETTESEGTVEKQNTLFNFFTENATILPRIQDKVSREDIVSDINDFNDGNLEGLEKIFMVGAWNNPTLLKQVELKDRYPNDKNGQTLEDLQVRNVPIGLEQVDFSILGVSGLKVNDRMRFTGIPSYNAKNRMYTIFSIEHTVDENMWQTDVTTKSVPLPGDRL